MFGMFGHNRERNTRLFSIVIGIVVIASMIIGSFALLV